MWGTSQTVQTTVVAQLNPAQPVAPTTTQLAKVNYGRPDTWRFLFGVQVNECPEADVGEPVLIRVDFDVIVGLGRSMIQMPAPTFPPPAGFAQFLISYGPAPINGQIRWTSVVRAPQLDDIAAAPGFRPNLDQIVAQDIQCSARVLALATEETTPVGSPVHVTLHAYFSPNVHMRPEWFDQNYRGNEQGGT
jgi:hypothetical protein